MSGAEQSAARKSAAERKGVSEEDRPIKQPARVMQRAVAVSAQTINATCAQTIKVKYPDICD